MNRRGFILGTGAAFAIGRARAAVPHQEPNTLLVPPSLVGPKPVPGDVLAKLKAKELINDPRIVQVISDYHAKAREPIVFPTLTIYHWLLPDDSGTAGFIAALLGTGLVEFAHQNQQAPKHDLAYTPNDPLIGTGSLQEWIVKGVGGSIGLDVAWGVLRGINTAITFGDPSIKIAIYNGGYTANTSLIDVPCAHLLTGYNAVDGSTNTADTSGHGTFITNLNCAIADNANQIAGVASGCSIIPILGGSVTGQVVAGLSYAVSAGAHVVYTSQVIFGDASTDAAFVATQAAGVFLANSSGDSGSAGFNTTCARPGGICFGGTDLDGSRWVGCGGESGYNPANPTFVTMMAPSGGCVGDIISINRDGSTNTSTIGTSFSAALAAGVVALMWSAQPRLVRDLASTFSILVATMTTVTGTTAGYNSLSGWGLINAGAAVAMAASGRWPRNQYGLLGVQ